MSLANLVTQYIVQYGFRIMGAVLVFIAALFVAKSVGRLSERWLNEQDLEPPLRLLLLRLVKALVVILGLLKKYPEAQSAYEKANALRPSAQLQESIDRCKSVTGG